MTEPLVSIIIPMYNQRADYLTACLDSALSQTYSNIEVVISDNHSTNDAPKILDKYRSYPNFKIIKPDTHLGLIDNFKFAADAANGEYITFLSSDDILFSTCIQKVASPLINNKSLSYAYCENAIINEKGEQQFTVRGNKLKTNNYTKKFIANRMYNHSEYWMIGGIIRRENYQKIKFVNDIIAGDWTMGFQLLKFGNVGYVNETLSAIRIHEREGEAKSEYNLRRLTHNKQRIEKHETIINDVTLLNEIQITKKKALYYRNLELQNCVISLIRNHHKTIVTELEINETFEFYKQFEQLKITGFLMNHYKSKFAYYFTYLIGLYRRTIRLFNFSK